jgi:hypothetical protein
MRTLRWRSAVWKDAIFKQNTLFLDSSLKRFLIRSSFVNYSYIFETKFSIERYGRVASILAPYSRVSELKYQLGDRVSRGDFHDFTQPPDIYRDSIAYYNMTSFFHVISRSLVSILAIIRRYIIRIPESVVR